MSELRDDIRRRVEQVVEYQFQNIDLLIESLTHASVAEHRLHSNERLEFLGDAVLGVIVCEYLFQHYPDFLEGELTKIKSAVVSRRACAEISIKLGLIDLLRLGKGMSGREDLPSSLAAAVFESMVAAYTSTGDSTPCGGLSSNT